MIKIPKLKPATMWHDEYSEALAGRASNFTHSADAMWWTWNPSTSNAVMMHYEDGHGITFTHITDAELHLQPDTKNTPVDAPEQAD